MDIFNSILIILIKKRTVRMRGYFLDNNIAHRNRSTAITASLYKGLTQCMLIDLTLLPHPIRENIPRQQGWCFGLPPGITPEQWPLDPNNGFPLNHGFTLLLPEDYRIYGPEIVALLRPSTTMAEHHVQKKYWMCLRVSSPAPPPKIQTFMFSGWQKSNDIHGYFGWKIY